MPESFDCYYCYEPIPRGDRYEVLGPFDRHEGWAHEVCRDDASERAYHRRIADLYGSSSPQTAREREEEDQRVCER